MTIPSTTLLSFLGVGVENRGYKLASYQFDCGFEFTTSFFGAAALARMRTQKKAPARWLIIGTTTSGWDSLYDCVAQLAPTAEARALDWALNVSSEMSGSTPKDRKPVSLARLREFEAAFSSVLGVDIRLITVEDDGEAMIATRHRCDYCARTYATKGNANRHEAKCFRNPGTRSCPTCVHFMAEEWPVEARCAAGITAAGDDGRLPWEYGCLTWQAKP